MGCCLRWGREFIARLISGNPCCVVMPRCRNLTVARSAPVLSRKSGVNLNSLPRNVLDNLRKGFPVRVGGDAGFLARFLIAILSAKNELRQLLGRRVKVSAGDRRTQQGRPGMFSVSVRPLIFVKDCSAPESHEF